MAFNGSVSFVRIYDWKILTVDNFSDLCELNNDIRNVILDQDVSLHLFVNQTFHLVSLESGVIVIIKHLSMTQDVLKNKSELIDVKHDFMTCM